jgi:tetratricopeptide (TPR) repeat protein
MKHVHDEGHSSLIADFTEMIRLNPNDWKSLGKRGEVYLKTGDNQKAIADFTEAIRLNLSNADAYEQRGKAYNTIGEYSLAIADYDAALQIKSDDADIFFNRGYAYFNKGEYEKAVSDFNEAIRLEPDDIEDAYAIHMRGHTYNKKGEYEKALADFNEAIRLQPENSSFLDSRGSLYNEKGEYEKAIADFNKALRLKPSNEDAYYGRAFAFEKTKDYVKAFEDYFLASKLDEDYTADFFTYLDTLLLDDDKTDILWNIPLAQLQAVPYFFINIISDFRSANLNSDTHKRLVKAVYTFWDQCRCKDDTLVLNQFTNLWALDGMLSSRKLRLFPVNYQNDPEEGKVFYMRLSQYLDDKKKPNEYIDSFTERSPEKVAFIRSLTTLGNTLLMWNSSYASNSGISIGVFAKTINKGQGIGKTIFLSEQEEADDKPKQGSTNVPFSKMGLYRVFYSDKDNGLKSNKPLQEIFECVAEFDEKEFTGEFKSLLLELFTSIAHLIKDTSYEHEKEYRLVYIDHIKENPYIQKRRKSDGIFDGIFIESEPVLFDDDEVPVYFSPAIDDITLQKYRHAFMLEGLPKKGSVEKLLRPSGIKFR